MPRDRRGLQIALLVAAAGVVAIIVYAWWPNPSVTASPASNGRGAAEPARAAPSGAPPAADVHLPQLQAERPKPVEAERNLFRFRPKPPPPPPPMPKPTGTPSPAPPTGPPTPTPPPAIPLKFIGTASEQGSDRKIAVFSDPTGRVTWGTEGSIIDGRYKLLRIGVESVEIAYLDGTGRRTMRMGGS